MSEKASADRGSAAGPLTERSPMPVPALLADLAGWAWRLLVLALAGYLVVRLFDRLYFIVLPFFGAMFATSLAYPLVRLLRHRGIRRLAATWTTVILAALVLGGISIFVVDRAIDEYPQLVSQTSNAVTRFRHFLTVDLHVKSSSTSSVGNTITKYLSKHESAVASGAVSGIATVAEALGAFVLWLFMTFFLLYDGDQIWGWIVHLFPANARARVRGAGDQAWDRLAGFVRGTFIIAVIHGVVAAVALSAMRVPLVAPLTLLVFLGSFLPIVGSIIFGSLAVAITLVTRGTVLGAVLAGILIIDNQIEAHYLQPMLVGRYVRLHPLVVAVSIAGGGLLEGIPGAVLAVPFVAVVYAVLRYLATGEDQIAGHQPAAEDDGKQVDLVPEADPPPA
ncbi:MAG TPA: AI-2E family transporter [Mycobacteriales bacterium]|nr:AI-2E family transporter [Mycobacteriales bacterium]